jgi:hypothetical protein
MTNAGCSGAASCRSMRLLSKKGDKDVARR